MPISEVKIKALSGSPRATRKPTEAIYDHLSLEARREFCETFQVKRIISGIMIIGLALSLIVNNEISIAAAPKAGTNCTKLNQTLVSLNINLICTKSGKKLIWAKVPELKKNSGPEIPKNLPTSFSDLYQNRSGISYSAWSQVSTIIKASTSKLGKTQVFVGPNTKPGNTAPLDALNLVSRAFPNQIEPPTVLIIYYAMEDKAWAKDKLASLISENDLSRITSNNGGNPVDTNCKGGSGLSCEGSNENTLSDGTALLLLGVPSMIQNDYQLSTPQISRFLQGQLEAHEYFHSLQTTITLNKDLGPDRWPNVWTIEGTAELFQNLVINYDSYEKYLGFRSTDLPGGNVDDQVMMDFLDLSNQQNYWNSFPNWFRYSLGSRIWECLVALKGPNAPLDVIKELVAGKNFEQAFQAVFGISYEEARPILAKTVAASYLGK